MIKTFLNTNNEFDFEEVELIALILLRIKSQIYVFSGIENPTKEDVDTMWTDNDHLSYLYENKTDWYSLTETQYNRFLQVTKNQ